MELLLISPETKLFFFSIAVFAILLGMSVVMYAIRTSGGHKYDPSDQVQVTPDEIIMREHFCADILNN